MTIAELKVWQREVGIPDDTEVRLVIDSEDGEVEVGVEKMHFCSDHGVLSIWGVICRHQLGVLCGVSLDDQADE